MGIGPARIAAPCLVAPLLAVTPAAADWRRVDCPVPVKHALVRHYHKPHARHHHLQRPHCMVRRVDGCWAWVEEEGGSGGFGGSLFSLDLSTTPTIPQPSIPEAPTWIMMLAGLAVIAKGYLR